MTSLYTELDYLFNSTRNPVNDIDRDNKSAYNYALFCITIRLMGEPLWPVLLV